MATWRVWLATLLLVCGVAFVATTAETGVIWWGVFGSLDLMFVPALIIDETRRPSKIIFHDVDPPEAHRPSPDRK